MHKSEYELDCIRRAAEITALAHNRIMGFARPGMWEYEVDAELRRTFRQQGSPRMAYVPTVASGPNCTVLHYSANKRRLQDGDLMLVDAACELDYYAADITRTFPVSGRFTEPQREIYELVLEAQGAAIAAVRPGRSFRDVHRRCVQSLVQGFVQLGLLVGEIDQLIESRAYKRYFMHRTSHWLGMDVHDVGAYCVAGRSRSLDPGMVLTIEPGVYIAEDDEQAPAQYRGIGVRIEDDVLVTLDSAEILTAAAVKSVEQVQQVSQS